MDMTITRMLGDDVRSSLDDMAQDALDLPAFAAVLNATSEASEGRMRAAQESITWALNSLGQGAAPTRNDELRRVMSTVDGHSVQACMVRSLLQVAIKIADGVTPYRIAESLGVLHFHAGQVARAAEAARPMLKAA